MKKNRRRNIVKKWAGRLHLWLGLITGLVVFIVAVTGCIYVFQDEIKDLVHDWRKVEPRDKSFIAPSELRMSVRERYPTASSNFVIYAGKDRPAAVYSVDGEKQYYFHFDPYSGEFLHAQDFDTDFFDIVRNLHMYLLLPENIGRQIVGVSTIIFLIMLLTGIILWWPKKLKNLKKSLKVKWDARWRRLNYDLHNISGFYVHILAVIVAITGLYFSYEWVSDGIYYLGNLGKEYESDRHIENIEQKPRISENPMDIAFYETIKLKPEDEMYFVWTEGEDHPLVTGTYPESLDFDHQSNFYFHPQTAELLQTHYYSEKSMGMQLQEMSYGLHTGQYFGLTGKIIAFFISLFVASLPVTGFIVWWGRKNRLEHLTS